MGIFGFVLLVLAGMLCGLLYFASRKPDEFKVERRLMMAAPPETVFAQINDLVLWQDWSPWAKKDPNAKAHFGAVTAGEGANFGWDGNNQVGKGQMTITQSVPAEKVVLRLEFEKPFKATNTAQFSLLPAAGGTEVVWSMHGPANLMSKVMDLVMNMDRMVGSDFEKGLASLKAICEGKSA
jgi:uncharacterized protein YndB with AHSA1/START domain